MKEQNSKFPVLREVLTAKYSTKQFDASDPLVISQEEIEALVKKSDDRIYNGKFNELIRWEDLKRKRGL